MSDHRPIGIFDSGQGGLTVVRELLRLLPKESLVYFGDTGRVPYGTKSRQTILQYAKQDIAFLQTKGVKMVIAACGTVSAVLTKEMQGDLLVPFTGVVQPAAEAASRATKTGQIGVIGTPAAIRSEAYTKAIQRCLASADITAVPCPLFVSLVENGYTDPNNLVVRLVAQDYLAPFLQSDVDTLILGCTHFPILKEAIAAVLGPRVTLIDPGKEAAGFAKTLLQTHDLLASQDASPSHTFYVSDDVENFTRGADAFLGTGLPGSCVQVVVP